MVVGPRGPRSDSTGRGPRQARPKQSVGDPALGGRQEFVPQRAAAQHRVGPQQALDDSQRTGGVAVVESFTDPGQTVRAPVRLVDGLEAGQGRTGQRDQQFLAPDLGRVVVQGLQDAVDQADPVPVAPALHDPGRPGGSGARGTATGW